MLKSEIGLTHFEGRSYVALHTIRLRGKNPEVTLEQVCRVMKWVCRSYLNRKRGTSESACTVETVQYHQRRNTNARDSRRKRGRVFKRLAALEC